MLAFLYFNIGGQTHCVDSSYSASFFSSYSMKQYFIIVSGAITALPAITAMRVALSCQEEAAFQGDFLKCETVTKINQTTFPFNLAFSGRLALKFKAFPTKFGCIYI